jgi:hypothetical protein
MHRRAPPSQDAVDAAAGFADRGVGVHVATGQIKGESCRMAKGAGWRMGLGAREEEANRVDSFSCKKFQKFLIALFAFSWNSSREQDEFNSVKKNISLVPNYERNSLRTESEVYT